MAAAQPATRVVREERRADAPLFVQPEWAREFPWLVQGITSREAGDFASYGAQTAAALQAQWRQLRAWTGAHTAVIGRQIHGARVRRHGRLSPGMLFADDSDGHMTSEPGVLLAVSVADCIPVFVTDPARRTVAVLHAGWRGTAAGILRSCIAEIGTEVRVHFGPGICGDCYEVGPEVHAALGEPVRAERAPVDLRAILARQCVDLGVATSQMTTSAWCTKCGDPPFYSHRAGNGERQVGIIGIR